LEENALWLGIAVMVFCFGSFVKHAFYYNIKARSWYNPEWRPPSYACCRCLFISSSSC
jgi:hypothetical protein